MRAREVLAVLGVLLRADKGVTWVAFFKIFWKPAQSV